MATMHRKQRAPRNRTVCLDTEELELYRTRLLKLDRPVVVADIEDRTIHQDCRDLFAYLPEDWADLIFVDPPYNLTKSFNGLAFREQSIEDYVRWLDTWFPQVVALLKPTGSMYVCADWRSSSAIHEVARKYLKVRNRITWEREKGRGSLRNWKNCSEDVWFFTKSDEYTFNVEAVKLKRRVIAPYRESDGTPRDWDRSDDGNYRLTHPSNLWNDLTIPFWSMPENTDHPTQKPEKLLAKIMLASSKPGDIVFDPFLGSGTTSVVARKLGRHYVGAELNEAYCCLAEKRLDRCKSDPSIQGYSDGVFWERNSLQDQRERGNTTVSSGLLPFSEQVEEPK